MQAVAAAADAVATGNRDCVVAGGVESMSHVPMGGEAYANLHPGLAERYNLAALEMGMTAETVAEKYGVSRETQDEYALRSHRRAAAATDSGRFDDEIVPIETDDGLVTEDEGIRRDTSLDQLAALPSAFVGDGTVTPGNASGIADGAAATLVTSRAVAEERGLDVLARVGAHEAVGVDPTEMGIGPVPATEGLLDRVGRTVDDYDLVELNEAFASQTVYAKRALGVDDERFNVNGGAIAIGHPLGASGARLPVTLVHEMRRRRAERGLATLCVGFGQGMAVEFAR
jgi:acetyl-CoA acyltransferase